MSNNYKIMEFLKKALPRYHGYFKTINKFDRDNISYYHIQVKKGDGYLKIKEGNVYMIREVDYSFYKPKKES